MKDDFFDPDLEPDASVLSVSATEETAVATDTTETPPADNGRKKRQIMGYDLSTLLIAGTAFIALVGYALWPDTPTQQAFIPDNTSQSVAVQAPPTLPPESSPAVAEPPSAPLSAPEISTTDDPAVPDELRQYSEANREAITKLNSHLSVLEQRLSATESRLQALQQRAQSPAPVATPVPARHQAAHSRQQTTNTNVRRSHGVNGWRIHTIYPGMAWLTHNGSTWSVQAGDVLQGLTIRSIDAQQRIVVTDKGVIRQGG